MKIKRVLLSSVLSSLVACSSYANMTSAEVYSSVCSKCHGDKAQGVESKKAPVLNNIALHDLQMTLEEIKSIDNYQSSGTDHDQMQHNMKAIIKKGMDFDAKDMANYIYTNFNKEAKNSGVAKIYSTMCAKCHGDMAQGSVEKSAPALNNKTTYDLKMTLSEIQSTDSYQSSGTSHDVMKYNQKAIEKMGMTYKPEEMAAYIYSQFYKGKK